MPHYLSVLAIFKNEAHIFAEWIEHYLKEGVEHFFLVDNGSTDDFRSQISPYDDRITLYERPERYAQVKIYNEIFASVRDLTDWLLPVDLDEFIYARHGTIADYLRTLDAGVGQVQIPWRFFASSHLVEQPELVIPNFVYRWRTGHDDTVETKSIVRSSSVVSLDIHFHHVTGKTIASDGSKVQAPGPFLTVSETLHRNSMLICNHYVLQSKDWFFRVKATRGAADSPIHDSLRNHAYWEERDRNEVLDRGLAVKRSPFDTSTPAAIGHLATAARAAGEARPKYWSSPEEGEAIWAQLKLVPDGCRVLEVGTAAGHVTRALKHKGCEITGIELDKTLAESAAPSCRRMIVGDIEALDLDVELPEEFDTILCGDVLEHLKDPDVVLRKLKRRLAPGGHLVVSMPNVAHASVRLGLLLGRFTYVEEGLLDATHLRFFTLASIIDLFNRNGLEILDLHRARLKIFDTEIHIDRSEVSAFAVRQVLGDPEATVYQFVFRAIPSRRANILADLRDSAFDAARELRGFHTLCMKKAWEAFHRQENGRFDARAWAWLALVARPSLKAALHWARSYVTLGAKRAG